jgi:FtsP/CotA-like multicopper oxidase with cupredoxin domain
MVLTCLTASPLASQNLEPILANDNRVAGGELREGVLTLRLEMREGTWRPHGEDGEAVPVYAFSEPGKPLQAPGPLIRVPQGTILEVTAHNLLPVAATLHGFHQRPGDDGDVVTVQPGATQQVRFVAGAPGTYLYLARAYGDGPDFPRVKDTFLAGALVVDPPGAVPNDRIFVLHRWNGPIRTAINGKSWPYTERLTYEAGETVRWRVINASDLSHPMHLHGSHFYVEGLGDGERYQTFAGAERPLEFTHLLEVNETMEMSWVPHQPGRWLYHCHRLPHMRFPVPLDGSEPAEAADHADHGEGPAYGMGGMIVGITVLDKKNQTHETAWKAERKLQLHVREQKSNPRFFELELREPGQTPAKGKANVSTGVLGPPIVLTQNQPVEIEVVNHLKEATSIHWHGIELDSYYDGVPGFGGIGEKKTPAVSAGGSFVARMAPPRAGTFIYHTHWHDDVQLSGGVNGPLIVLPPGETHRPATDKIFFFNSGEEEPFGNGNMILLNGTPQPQVMRLKTGTKYRFRLLNITGATANLRVSLRQGGVPVQWRVVAKDAAALPPAAAKMKRADQIVSVGETYDVEYAATGPQELTLEGLNPNDGRRATQTLIFSDSAHE